MTRITIVIAALASAAPAAHAAAPAAADILVYCMKVADEHAADNAKLGISKGQAESACISAIIEARHPETNR
jgi:hypothetical protein